MAQARSAARTTIIKVLVGSHAHGLADPDSDRDYRSVFVVPTVELFRLGFKYPATSWTKEHGDEAAWEIRPFLELALQCHPLILETFLAPLVEADRWGEELRALFSAVWSPRKTYDAFIGYAINQRTKFLDKKDQRPEKYAAAYVRVLWNLCELLETGSFTVHIRDTAIGDRLWRIKHGEYRMGEIIDLGEELTQKAAGLLYFCRHDADPAALDAFLIRLRKAFLP
ncbi:MAG: hypothetical protein D6690_05920 [Nitrospirae bacterium]|nr:MAG: hypothetical protein D6690_05920 [Nitrospirota bacterium]